MSFNTKTRTAFASLALQLRRNRHDQLAFARQARRTGNTTAEAEHVSRAARYLDDARWYLAQAKPAQPGELTCR